MKKQLALVALLLTTASVCAAAPPRREAGVVQVQNRAGTGVVVALDEDSDGTSDLVWVVQTTTKVQPYEGRASVVWDDDAGSLAVYPAGDAESIVATLRPAKGQLVLPGVVGIAQYTGPAAKAGTALRLPTQAELAALKAEETAALVALGKDLSKSPDPDHQALAELLEEFEKGGPVTESPCGAGVPCYPDPPPDGDPTGGSGGPSWCSRVCGGGFCFVTCNYPYSAICACTPGTNAPICSCTTNNPRH